MIAHDSSAEPKPRPEPQVEGGPIDTEAPSDAEPPEGPGGMIGEGGRSVPDEAGEGRDGGMIGEG
jgi:hypothetical protein